MDCHEEAAEKLNTETSLFLFLGGDWGLAHHRESPICRVCDYCWKEEL